MGAMRSIKFTLPAICLMLAIVVSLSAVITIAYATNLLANSGFDDGYHNQAGVSGRVAGNWFAINEIGNPTYYSSCEYIGSCAAANWSEKLDGTSAQYIESQDIERCCPPGKPFKIDLAQTVPVVSGTAYAVSGFMVTFCAGTANNPNPPCPSNYYIGKSVGLDPLGGMLPTATSVIWSEEDRRDARVARWVNLNTVARAQSVSMTVFARMNWPFQFHGALGWMDAFQITPAPVVTITARPATQISPTITVSWTHWMDPALRRDGDYRLYYDVEARDVLTTSWTRLASDAVSTTVSYSGQVGHTYAFRVRPWAHQPQLDECTTCAGANHFFPGFFSNPITVTVVNDAPPSSSVAPLPSLQTSNSFSVSWSGSDDVTPPSALRYDLQSRDGLTGVWTNWLTNTASTSATFVGEAGHTYFFRSRAYDGAGNVEAYPADYDAFTTIVAGSISGAIRNLREQAVPLAMASLASPGAPIGLSPLAPNSAVSDLNGQYTVYVTASQTYSLSIVKSGFGTLPPISVSSGVTNLLAILPPRVDLIRNGQFESGELGGWTASGLVSPTIAPVAHSGNFAAALGVVPTVGADSVLQQTAFLSPTLSSPTLSFFYRVPSGASVPFTLTISSGSTVSETTPSITDANWTHRWIDLSPYAGQPITLTFTLQQLAPASVVYLDEVSIGSAESASINQIFLPTLLR